MSEEVFLSVIIPAYNEEKRLGRTLEELDGYLKGKEYKYEIIVVDDGSSDGTADVALSSDLAERSILKVFLNDKNRGKGYSVREGFKRASGSLVLFTDADLSTPIAEIEKLEEAIHSGVDIAIASRSMRNSDIKVRQPLYRVLMGKIFNLFAKCMGLRGITDTQCGFKLFKNECIKNILPGLRINGFSFDVELLYSARRQGYTIKEVPVIWSNFQESKVQPLVDSTKMFLDLIRIKFMHR